MNFNKKTVATLIASCLGLALQAQASTSETDNPNAILNFKSAQAGTQNSTERFGLCGPDEICDIICEPDQDCDDGPVRPTPPTPKYGRASSVFNSEKINLEWSAVNSNQYYYRITRTVTDQNGNDLPTYKKIINNGLNTTYQDTLPAGLTAKYEIASCEDRFWCGNAKTLNEVTTSGEVYAVKTVPVQSLTATGASNGRTTTDIDELEQEMAQLALGKAYDVLKAEVIEGGHCFKEEDKSLYVLGGPQYDGRFSYDNKVVNNMKDLASAFGYTNGISVSGAYGDVEGDFNYAKSLISRTNRVEQTSTLAGTFSYTHNLYSMKQPVDIDGLGDTYLDHLRPTGDNLSFRTACADQYISSVTTGRQIMYTIRAVDSTLTHEASEDIVTNLDGALKDLLSVGFNSQSVTQVIDTYSKNTFEIHVEAIGFEPSSNLSSFTRAEDFLNYIAEFFAESADEVPYGLIDYTTKNYPIPSFAAGQAYFDVFYDYSDEQKRLAQWNLFDSFMVSRCGPIGYSADLEHAATLSSNLWDSGAGKINLPGTNYPARSNELCQAMKTKLTLETLYCTEQQHFAQCAKPNDVQCSYGGGSMLCTKMGSEIHYLERTAKTEEFVVESGSCIFGPCYDDSYANVCLEPGDVVNYSIRNVTGPEQSKLQLERGDQPWGMSTHIHEFKQVEAVSNYKPYLNRSDNKMCSTVYAKVKRKGGGVSKKGKYRAENTLAGFKTGRSTIIIID